MENQDVLDPRPHVLKKLIWDVFPHCADIAGAQRRLGLVPDTEDGMEFDHADADVRLSRVEPLEDTASVLTHYIAEVMGVYMLMSVEASTGEEMPELPDGFTEAFAAQNHEIIYLGALSLISHLMDEEILVYGPGQGL